jgi:hypothetical protein
LSGCHTRQYRWKYPTKALPQALSSTVLKFSAMILQKLQLLDDMKLDGDRRKVDDVIYDSETGKKDEII